VSYSNTKFSLHLDTKIWNSDVESQQQGQEIFLSWRVFQLDLETIQPS